MSNKLFLSNRKMELSSGKLARFADGSAVVQVKKKVETRATSKFLSLNIHYWDIILLKGYRASSGNLIPRECTAACFVGKKNCLVSKNNGVKHGFM